MQLWFLVITQVTQDWLVSVKTRLLPPTSKILIGAALKPSTNPRAVFGACCFKTPHVAC